MAGTTPAHPDLAAPRLRIACRAAGAAALLLVSGAVGGMALASLAGAGRVAAQQPCPPECGHDTPTSEPSPTAEPTPTPTTPPTATPGPTMAPTATPPAPPTETPGGGGEASPTVAATTVPTARPPAPTATPADAAPSAEVATPAATAEPSRPAQTQEPGAAGSASTPPPPATASSQQGQTSVATDVPAATAEAGRASTLDAGFETATISAFAGLLALALLWTGPRGGPAGALLRALTRKCERPS